jgi:hypothetical protein
MEQAKPVAKSLHTVSVLVNLTRHILKQMGLHPKVALEVSPASLEAAMAQACMILELDGKPDVYDLKGQALKQLTK